MCPQVWFPYNHAGLSYSINKVTFMSTLALLKPEQTCNWILTFLFNFQLPSLHKKNTQLRCPITKLKTCLAGSTGYWQLLKPSPQGQDCTLANPMQSVKYSTFHGWLAPVPPCPPTWLAQINTAPHSTSQSITHSKQIKYGGVWWGGMVFSWSPSIQSRPYMRQRFIRQLNRAWWNVWGGASLHCSPLAPLGTGWTDIRRGWGDELQCCTITRNGIWQPAQCLDASIVETIELYKALSARRIYSTENAKNLFIFPILGGSVLGLDELLPLVSIMFVCRSIWVLTLGLLQQRPHVARAALAP